MSEAELRQRCRIAESAVQNRALKIEALDEKVAELQLALAETRSRLDEYIEAFGPLEQ